MSLASLLGLLILLVALCGWLVLLLASLEPLLWWLIRRVVAARGLVRASATLARLCRAGFEHDRRGGAAMAGARCWPGPGTTSALRPGSKDSSGAAARSGRPAWSRPG